MKKKTIAKKRPSNPKITTASESPELTKKVIAHAQKIINLCKALEDSDVAINAVIVCAAAMCKASATNPKDFYKVFLHTHSVMSKEKSSRKKD